jgi:hypothetical protein
MPVGKMFDYQMYVSQKKSFITMNAKMYFISQLILSSPYATI